MRPHRNPSTLSSQLKHISLATILVVSVAGVAHAQPPTVPTPSGPAVEPVTSPGGPVVPPANDATIPPQTTPDVSAPASVPLKWEPGIAVEQLPAGAYPEATMDGGMFGKSLTLGAPTRGLWGSSLWMTFHGLQWPYMPKTGIGVSGYGWVDTGYQKIKRPHDGSHVDRQFWLQEARGVLRLTPTYSNGSFFAQAQIEFVGNKEQGAAAGTQALTDDLWVRVGHWNRWDLQLGRFESWEVFHLGMGLDVNTLERKGAYESNPGDAVSPYLVRFPFETRPSTQGYGAVHLYPTSFLRFELLGLAGPEGSYNSLGTRPAMILDFGMVKFKIAGEYIKYRFANNYNDPALGQVESRNTRFQRGVGGGVIFIFDPRFEAGANLSAGVVDQTKVDNSGDSEPAATFDILSVGGFANARIVGDWIAGAGADFTRKADYNFLGSNKAGYFDNLQAFGALQYVVAKRLFIKGVFGYSRATFSPGGVPTDIVNTMYSGRIRLMYLF